MRPDLHPACAAFPAMPDTDLQSLAADIKTHGLLEAVTLTPDGLLLDGRCRWDACEIAGIEPRTVMHDGDPVSFVLSKNRHRRHMTTSQKAMVVAVLANLPAHRPKKNRYNLTVVSDNTSSVSRLGEQVGLSRATVQFARTILTNAAPHIVKMVQDGVVHVRVAAEAVRTTSRAVQAGWTVTDVEREGRKIISNYPSNRSRKPAAAQPVKPTQQPEPRPYTPFQFPTPE